MRTWRRMEVRTRRMNEHTDTRHCSSRRSRDPPSFWTFGIASSAQAWKDRSYHGVFMDEGQPLIPHSAFFFFFFFLLFSFTFPPAAV